MSVLTFKAIVENGYIKILGRDVPNNTKIYVVIPDSETVIPVTTLPQVKIHSPRLANPAQIADFAKIVVEESSDFKKSPEVAQK
jgi:hypothetical protein